MNSEFISPPSLAIKKISLSFIKNNEPINIARGNILSLDKCVVFHSGRYSLVRKSDGLYLYSIDAPMVVGLIIHEHYVLVAETHCRVNLITREEAYQIIRKENLWEELCYLTTYTEKIMLYRDEKLVGRTSYTIIKNQLIELCNMDEVTKATTNVCNYIMQRTRLSRSTIMNILAELKKGKYIEMENGNLIDVHVERLPSRY